MELFRVSFRPLPFAAVFAAFALVAGPAAAAATRVFRDAIRSEAAAAAAGTHIVRRELSNPELTAPIVFSISLRMRDVDGLQARVAAGEKISPEEMASRYLPLASDYDQVVAWLAGQGFTPALTDRNHTVIFARGPVLRAAQALGVTFARVTAPGSALSSQVEYTSAVTAPSLPAELADSVLSVDGLQPEARLRHVRPRFLPDDAVAGKLYVTPNDVAAAYHTSAAWTGKGQTIAIIDEGAATTSDLSTFWATVGVTQTVANLTTVNVLGGPSASGDTSETALDVEWAGALAPDAQLRLYLSSNALNCFTQILNDLPTHPSLSIVSLSFSAPELFEPTSGIASLRQTLLQLAAGGLTVFCASGDGGSNPNNNTGAYAASNALSAEYPASDPSATGVGGTALALTSSFVASGETVWDQRTSSNPSASGGGVSVLFSAPSWQTAASGRAQRCVPDVAAIAAGSQSGSQLGAYAFVGGAGAALVGTSLSAPVWAAFAAQLNQARAAAGLGHAGLLGPLLYPLLATSVFTDITSGSNGAYSAGVGYDLCTGLGSPNVSNLIAALTPPTITTQPQSLGVNAGSAFSFSVVATSASPLSYQWSQNGTAISGATASTYAKAAATTTDAGSYTVLVSNSSGSVTSSAATLTVTVVPPPAITTQPVSSSVNLGSLFSFSVVATGGNALTYQWLLNGVAIAGATGSSYVKGAAAAGDAGSYTVVVTNSAGTVTSAAATLSVSTPAAASSGGGGGGGGGAPSAWFYGALALLVLGRQATRRSA